MVAQDYTVVNITPAQVVTRMAEPLLWDYVVTDFAYVQRMGGIHPDPTVVHGLPDWLTETVIPVPEIEAFKEQLKQMGMA